MNIQTINPATEEIIETYTLLTPDQIEQKVDAAQNAQALWKKNTLAARSKVLLKAAELLKLNAQTYAHTITNEMGKTLEDAKAEVKKCAWVCEYYANYSKEILRNKPIPTEASKSYVSYKPLGLVLAVMPWNFPFWQVFRFLAPALMAGNGALLKHASNVPACGNLIQDLIQEAGFPDGLFQHLIIASEQVSGLIANPSIKAVTLTGSEKAGAAVASAAAQHIKKAVLELGGNDPYLILKDADLKLAASQCAQSRLLNAGQSCIGAKRFIVVEAVYDRFLDLFTEEMKKAKMGLPTSPSTTLAPMARIDLRDELHQQVLSSIKKGAVLHLGGNIPAKKGAFYPATILTHVKRGMSAYHEEFFGPVAAVIKVKDEKEAIFVANDSIFGLGAAVFTKDVKRGERIAHDQLQAGSCFVNHLVKSDPRLPFGGIKTSGYGRELSDLGLKEFMNAKTVYIA